MIKLPASRMNSLQTTISQVRRVRKNLLLTELPEEIEEDLLDSILEFSSALKKVAKNCVLVERSGDDGENEEEPPFDTTVALEGEKESTKEVSKESIKESTKEVAKKSDKDVTQAGGKDDPRTTKQRMQDICELVGEQYEKGDNIGKMKLARLLQEFGEQSMMNAMVEAGVFKFDAEENGYTFIGMG